MSRDRISYLVIPVAALIAILPLIVHGPSCGHDFDFHIINWLEAAAQFRHGNLHPQWAFSPAWNAGEPRFVFYPPFSWTLGAILGLILPWTWTPIAYTWLALTASGLAMHRLARAHASPAAALLASTLYLANPYMLFTAYERTAYAELLAAAFLPLLFHAILRPHPTVHAIAVPLAFLWLTNAPAAVMGTYTLALLATLRIIQSAQLQNESPEAPRIKPGPTYLALTTFAGTLLGLSLAAFYILPAATERPLVQIAMVVIPGMRVDDNTLFHHTGITEDALTHDAVLHTASLLAILLLTATFVMLFIIALSQKQRKVIHTSRQNTDSAFHPSATRKLPFATPPILLPLMAVTLTIVLLLTPVSLPIWHHAPELAFLQFPWRLLAILATTFALSTAGALDQLLSRLALRRHLGLSEGTLFFGSSKLLVLVALTLAAFLTFTATPRFRQPCEPEDTVQSRQTAFQAHTGFEPTDEYTPANADNDSLQPNDPPYWLSPNSDAPPPPRQSPGPAPTDLTLISPISQHLILNLRQYPAWHVTLNNNELSSTLLTQTPRADGLTNLPVPPGVTQLHLIYRATSLEHAAEILSFLALLMLELIACRTTKQGQHALRKWSKYLPERAA